MGDDDGKTPEDYVADDEVCRTCVGITYMSQQMRENKNVPWCLGLRRTLKIKIPPKQLDQLEKEAGKDFEWQMSVGYTLITRRMDRKGLAPIGIFAVTYSKPLPILADSETKSTRKSPSAFDQHFTEQSALEQAKALAIDFDDKMTRGVKLQLSKMLAMSYKILTPEFPVKFCRSIGSLANASYRTARTTVVDCGRLVTFVFGGK